MKKTNLLPSLIFCCFACLSTLAHADGSGGYGSLVVGASSYNSSNDGRDTISAGFPSSATSSDSNAALGFAFGYHFNPNFALEWSYLDFGEARARVNGMPASNGSFDSHVDAYGSAFDVIGLVPLTDTVALFGRGGLFLYGVDAHVFGPGGPFFDSTSGSTYDLGAGASFEINRRLGLRLGYTYFHDVGDAGFTGDGPIGLFYAQLVFRFR